MLRQLAFGGGVSLVNIAIHAFTMTTTSSGVPVCLYEGGKLVSRFDALRSGHGSDRIVFDGRAFF